MRDADIICTVTATAEPILKGAWVAPGAHVNVVGSGFAVPAEIDPDLVADSRFVVDGREGVLATGPGVFARQRSRRDRRHAISLANWARCSRARPGRTSENEITLYKSLRHIVQDQASGWALYAGRV